MTEKNRVAYVKLRVGSVQIAVGRSRDCAAFAVAGARIHQKMKVSVDDAGEIESALAVKEPVGAVPAVELAGSNHVGGVGGGGTMSCVTA